MYKLKEQKEKNPNDEKYFRYLERYIKKYRVKAYYDLETDDFPRDSAGTYDDEFEDLYIPCKKGMIKHATCDTLYWYTDSLTKGRNIYEEIIQNGLKDIVLEYEETSSDVLIYFDSKDIEKIAEIVEPLTGGSKIKPFNSSNLPKQLYIIPKSDEEKYNNISSKIKIEEKFEKMRFIMNIMKDFDAIIEKNKSIKGKSYNVKEERKKSALNLKMFIHSIGMWDEFIKFFEEKIN